MVGELEFAFRHEAKEAAQKATAAIIDVVRSISPAVETATGAPAQAQFELQNPENAREHRIALRASRHEIATFETTSIDEKSVLIEPAIKRWRILQANRFIPIGRFVSQPKSQQPIRWEPLSPALGGMKLRSCRPISVDQEVGTIRAATNGSRRSGRFTRSARRRHRTRMGAALTYARRHASSLSLE
jgi:hypothetical protein